MKTVIIFCLFLASNLCYAGIYQLNVISLKKCRQDFAVKLCKTQPLIYDCYRFRKTKAEYVTWQEAFENEKNKDRLITILQKVNRRNTIIWPNHCIAIPKDIANRDEMLYTPFNKYLPDTKEKIIIVDLNIFAWAAYQNHKLLKWGSAVGGIGRCKETGKYECKTPVGIWKVIRKGPAVSKSQLYPVECEDKSICGHPLYHLIQFHPNGSEIHGDKTIGTGMGNISHGCVRVHREDSKWLNKEFAETNKTIIKVLPYK